MNWVIDSSVAIKWFVIEENRDEAHALFFEASKRNIKLIAPDFILIEVANILWKKTNKQEINKAQCAEILNNITEFIDELIPATRILKEAQALSQALNHPIYDCLYLAVAQLHKAPFITADAKLYAKVLEKKLAFSCVLLSNNVSDFLSV